MRRLRISGYRLAAALGIAFGIGVAETICVVYFLPQWANSLGDLPLQPASYIVTCVAKAHPLGFEDQVLYLLLTLVLHWLFYSALVYLLLTFSRKGRSAASGNSK